MRHPEPRGYSLLELSVALGLMGLLSLGLASLVHRQLRSRRELEAKRQMQAIARRIHESMGLPELVQASADHGAAPGNKFLRACIGGSEQGMGRCIHGAAHKQVSLELHLPPSQEEGTAKDLRQEKRILAGSLERPIYYSLDGKHCGFQSSPQCPLAATAYFWASCPPSSTFKGRRPSSLPESCSLAQSVHLRFRLEHLPHPQGHNSLGKLPPIPPQHIFKKPWAGARSLPVHLIPYPRSLEFACGLNETLISIKDGKAVCACLPPFSSYGSLHGACIGRDHVCSSPTQRFRGMKKDVFGSFIPHCVEVRCSQAIRGRFEMQCVDREGNQGWLEGLEAVEPEDGELKEDFPKEYQEMMKDKKVCMSQPCAPPDHGHNLEDEDDICAGKTVCYEKHICCYEVGPKTAS